MPFVYDRSLYIYKKRGVPLPLVSRIQALALPKSVETNNIGGSTLRYVCVCSLTTDGISRPKPMRAVSIHPVKRFCCFAFDRFSEFARFGRAKTLAYSYALKVYMSVFLSCEKGLQTFANLIKVFYMQRYERDYFEKL